MGIRDESSGTSYSTGPVVKCVRLRSVDLTTGLKEEWEGFGRDMVRCAFENFHSGSLSVG